MPYPKIKEESYLRFIPSQLDHLADFTASSLRASLNSIAPVKKKTKPVKRLAPWYNLNTHKLKWKTDKLEKKWCSTKVEESSMACQDTLITNNKHYDGGEKRWKLALRVGKSTVQHDEFIS